MYDNSVDTLTYWGQGWGTTAHGHKAITKPVAPRFVINYTWNNQSSIKYQLLFNAALLGGPKEAGVGEAVGCHRDPVRWTAMHICVLSLQPCAGRGACRLEGLGPEQTLLPMLHGMAQHTLGPPPGWSADGTSSQGAHNGFEGARPEKGSPEPTPPTKKVCTTAETSWTWGRQKPKVAQEPARPSAHTVVPGKGPLLPVWG